MPLGTGANYTEQILATLEHNSVQDGIKAIFFVQTHVPIRGGSEAGQELMRRMGSAGHLVGVHTGSTQDHVDHRRRALGGVYDWNHDGVLDESDGTSALECDLRRAKARIKTLTGVDPVLVRPTYGATNATVRRIYRKVGLRMLLWHVDSRDALDHARGAAVIRANVARGIRRAIDEHRGTIIVLFHDIQAGTQAHLDDYLIAIYEAAESRGKVALFPTTTDELNAWLADLLGLSHEEMGSRPYEVKPAGAH